MKTKPAKKPAKKPVKASVKKARITKDSFTVGRTLQELVQEWDAKLPAPRTILQISEDFEEQFNRLYEAHILMECAGDDLFDRSCERTGAILSVAERMIKECSEKCAELNSELCRANRLILAKEG